MVDFFYFLIYRYGAIETMLRHSVTFSAGCAFGCKDTVEVVDTVDLVVEVHREGDTVQTVVAHAAPAHVHVDKETKGV